MQKQKLLEYLYAFSLLLICLTFLHLGNSWADPVLIGHGSNIYGADRELLTGDIAHYSFTVPVGDGPFDVIGMHRVVKEKSPGTPIMTKQSIMLLHDSSGLFRNGFLDHPSIEKSTAVFFAENDVDVWGIDLGWSLVPVETTDFSFMEAWGLDKDLAHIEAGLSIARDIRRLTGNGWRRMVLLGHSRGGTLGYAYVNWETQIPPGHRHVAGFIPVDIFFKTDVEYIRLLRCGLAAAKATELAGGIYQEDRNLQKMVGQLALYAPNNISPIASTYTNIQLAMLVGAFTNNWTPVRPNYHIFAGIFNSFPYEILGLAYTAPATCALKLAQFSPYIPNQEAYDAYSITCDNMDVPWDDHLAEVTVPVMYISAAGGFGESGIYTTTLLGSKDVTILKIRLLDPLQEHLDFGHNDLFTAENADSLVYQPILEWMNARKMY